MQARENGAKYFSLLTKNILAEKMHANVSRELYMLITLVRMCALSNPGFKN
jgi:hypothetical protein